MRKIGTLLACLGLLTFGCDDSRDGDDGGGIMIMDSGPGSDSGPTGTDSGPTGDRFSPCTENTPLPQNVAAPTAPACDATTGTCAMACADATCFQACIDADPGATAMMNPCSACVFVAQTACVNQTGCQADWEEVACCVNQTCPTDAMLSCIGTTCMAANSAWETCANAAVSGCGAAIDVCFP